jgi:hypothetical protein
MKFKNLLIAASFFMVTAVSFGQSQEIATRKDALDKREATLVEAKNKANSLPVLNTTDGYMGMKSEILKRLSVSEIPLDFPKYKEGTPAGEYKKQMKSWAKGNQNLLKEEYKKK